MAKIEMIYEGDLRCALTLEPSGEKIKTDAPKDSNGKGEFFSPTDLVGAAAGSCMLTMMGFVAQRSGVNMDGARAEVLKEMATAPVRRIGKLALTFAMPPGIPKDKRPAIEKAGYACPVKQSLHPDIETVITFHYPD